MGFLDTIRNSNFWIRLTNWEYWPFEIAYLPVGFYWIWLSIKARSPFFFSASNPSIEYGGMLGESKIKILDLIPDQLKPLSILITLPTTFSEVMKGIQSHQLGFPLIFKPDIGERGFMVKKINSEQDVKNYLREIRQDFLIQDFIDAPVEMGVFYYRYPDQEQGVVSSIVTKDLLSVTGDGSSTVEALIKKSPRAKLQLGVLRKTIPELLQLVPSEGEKIELVPYGNHCRGARFMDGCHLINDTLQQQFDEIAKTIDGFYFGRFDIRCKSIEDLYSGNFKIIELNGAGSEPAHIYDKKVTLFQAYRSIFKHLNALCEISAINRKKGVPYLSFKEAWYVFNQTPFIKRVKGIA